MALPAGAPLPRVDALAVAGGCGVAGWRSPDLSRPDDCTEPLWVELAQARPDGAPDVLLIIVDTLRADHVTRSRTPRIVAHAEQAWWPEQAWSPAPWTQPSVAALFSGRPPWALFPQAARALPDAVTTWIEQLETHERWLIGTNPYVSDKRGFHQGFSRFAMAEHDTAAVAQARDWWDESRRGPRLLVVHLIGPHLPYAPATPPPGEGRRVKHAFDDLDGISLYGPEDQARIAVLYAADVAEVDGHVGALLDLVGPDAITAVVSDHGEELFEHGGFEHGHALWPEITRVHAALRVPGQAPSRPAGPVRLQDIGQAIALAAGLPRDPLWSPPTDVVRLGYPSTRREPVHTDGIVAPEGVLLRGKARHVEGDVAALEARLAKADALRWRGERTDHQWCDVTVVAGQELRLPASTAWREAAPPTTWGPARLDGDQLILSPQRSGIWQVSGIDGQGCRTERIETLRPMDALELQGLRALGYVE